MAMRSDQQPEYDKHVHHIKMSVYRNKMHHNGSFEDTIQSLKHDIIKLYKELLHAGFIPYTDGTNGIVEPKPLKNNPDALRQNNQLPFSLWSIEAVAIHFDFDTIDQLLIAWKSIDTRLLGNHYQLYEEAKIMEEVETHVLKEIKLLLDHQMKTLNSTQKIGDQITVITSLEETILGMTSIDMQHPGTTNADTLHNKRYFQTLKDKVKWLVNNGSISSVHDVIDREIYLNYFRLQDNTGTLDALVDNLHTVANSGGSSNSSLPNGFTAEPHDTYVSTSKIHLHENSGNVGAMGGNMSAQPPTQVHKMIMFENGNMQTQNLHSQ